MSVNSFGCLDSMFGIYTDTISHYDQPTINLLPASGLVCPNDSVQLSCQGSSIIDWFGPTGAISSGTNIIYSNLPGFYYCLQTVDTGCILFSNTVELMQYSSPTLIASPPSVCLTDSTTISVLSSPGSNINWLPPLSGIGTTQVVSAGIYFCDVIVCGDTSNLSITINSYPQPAAPQITIAPPNLISTIAQSYQWLLNGIPIGLANQQIYTPTQPGTYTVMITDSNGCTAISDQVLITSIDEYQIATSLSIHPNPVNSYIQIVSSDANINLQKANFTLYDMQGQKINLTKPDFKNRIDVSYIANGVYFLEVKSGNNIATLKVVIINQE
ncbi:MAG: T9SS type A sorting domain-containing protein [Bacteroidetes bacterium]|nr:T9SS type A sorting domain-containing protein [Bacteroidota bacterium]